MRIVHIVTALAPAVMLSACATSAPPVDGDTDRRAENVPAAEPTGEPVSCIDTNRIRGTDVRSDAVIDFELDGGRIFRNRLPNRCSGLGFEKRFAYETHIGQLCSSDTITVLYTPPQPGPTCGLGEFQPVRLTKR